MTSYTPQQYKQLAEAMGKQNVRIIHTSINAVVVYNSNQIFWLKNPARREEVLLWLLGKGWSIANEDPNGYWFTHYTHSPVISSDYTAALLEAAMMEVEK